jgi:hypothetical protein
MTSWVSPNTAPRFIKQLSGFVFVGMADAIRSFPFGGNFLNILPTGRFVQRLRLWWFHQIRPHRQPPRPSRFLISLKQYANACALGPHDVSART